MRQKAKIEIVALGGGSGTRFWPLSREHNPKQLLSLGNKDVLLKDTFERLKAIASPAHWWMVVGQKHADACINAVKTVPLTQVLIEPLARNTAAAIGLAAVHIAYKDSEAVMVVVPADHYVGKPGAFRKAIKKGIQVADQGEIVTLGICPQYPETGYGYIQRGQIFGDSQEVFKVERFIEKPTLPKAKKLVAAGDTYWNAGVFIMRVDRYLEELERFLPDTFRALTKIRDAIRCSVYERVLFQQYKRLRSISVDYGIMEHTQHIKLVPVNCAWSDIGSWRAFHALIPKDENGNVVKGRGILLDCEDSLCYATPDHMIGAIGLKNMVLVHTSEATLIVPKDQSQRVRDIIAQIKQKKWKRYL